MEPTDNHENFDELRIRRIKAALILFLVACILLFAAVILIKYIETGRLVVETGSSNNNITVTKVGDKNPNNPFSISASGHLSRSLHTGQYLVSVTGNSSASTQVVNIGSRKTSLVNINPAVISPIEPVASLDAEDISANSSSLFYVDGPDGQLSDISSQGLTNGLGSGVELQNVQWSASTGIGVGEDKNSRLYNIDGGSITPLNTSYTPTAYSVSPNGTIFIASGPNIYMGNKTGSFKSIYYTNEPSSTVPVLVGYNNKVALIIPEQDSNDSGDDDDSSHLFLVNESGKEVNKAINVTQASWSPTGSFLAVAGRSNVILDGSTLKQLYTIPVTGGSITNFVWLNNTTLLYGLGSNLWTYNLQTQSANQLASVGSSGYVADVALDQTRSYVYILVQNAQSDTDPFQLERFSLSSVSSSVPAILQELEVYLPSTYNGCLIGYVNFVSPIITTSGSDSANQNCISQAQAYLQLYGVDTSQLIFSPSN